jgi:hypothetical protein
MKAKEFITEAFINLIHDDNKKNQYKNEVFDLLYNAYAKIGGIGGSGFRSPDDMVANIPFWKLVVRNGKVVAVSMYKDTEGRKRVAVATDGTETGKEGLADIVRNESGRSYGEVSGPSLSFTKKNLPAGELNRIAIPIDKVQQIIGKRGKEIRMPQDDDPEILRHPELKEFFYQRKISEHWHTKLMIGTPGITIK